MMTAFFRTVILYLLLIVGLRLTGKRRIGKDESWLARQLEKQGYKEAGEVFLAMADGNQVTVFPMKSKREPADLADR